MVINIVVAIGILITLVTAVPVFTQMAKHPKGLHILFFAEMWERFSYYGMRALLIFYLTQHFLFSDRFASTQYGAYTSLVYLLPLIGGFVADRYLGNRKAIAYGALLLVAGHLAMGIEGRPSEEALQYEGESYSLVAEGRGGLRTVQLEVDEALYSFTASRQGDLLIAGLPEGASLPDVLPAGSFETEVVYQDQRGLAILYLALSLIIMGVGFLKASISSIVGQLYDAHDPRRDGGFTLYYYGINLGAFWAAILCGLLGETVGWVGRFRSGRRRHAAGLHRVRARTGWPSSCRAGICWLMSAIRQIRQP